MRILSLRLRVGRTLMREPSITYMYVDGCGIKARVCGIRSGSGYTGGEVVGLLTLFQEFFLRVKDLVRKLPSGVDSYVKFGEREKQLLWKLQDTKAAVHKALCGK